jgi:hypothetical protein
MADFLLIILPCSIFSISLAAPTPSTNHSRSSLTYSSRFVKIFNEM